MTRLSYLIVLMLFVSAAGLTGLACEANPNPSFGSDDDSSTDSDSDTDTDTDTDSDTDSDSDSDTGYEGPAIPETCEDAAVALNSVGCEFFVADLDVQDGKDGNTYSVVVSNPHEDQTVEVAVEHGQLGELYNTTLAPFQLEVINMSCDALCLAPPQQVQQQGIATGAGFRLVSDVPVLAYQWNPYGVGLASTDASLLIPVTSLDGTYVAASWGSGPGATWWPELTSEITVVITEDETEISFIPSVDVAEHGGLGPYPAGVETGTFVLNAFDVITLRPNIQDEDMTGTAIQASAPVVVYGCHSCGNVPSSSWTACDHVEEQILPLAAWGDETVLAHAGFTPDCTNPLVVWRIIAGADNMTVSFDPPAPLPAGDSYSFAQQGEMLVFESADDHFVVGLLNDPEDTDEPEAPFFAYQMLPGCSYTGCSSCNGDPMMLSSPPAGQYLDRYVFTTDDLFDFTYDHIVIVRSAGTEVTLECLGLIPDTEFTPVGSTEFEVARIYIDDPESSTPCTDGANVITATEPFGLSVVGTASANSYGYLGGVGVRAINPNPVIE
jgi:hypothetical protein